MSTMQDVLKSYKEQDGYRFIVSVSGGKDSAALAIYLKQKYPELPFEYLFSDTECELPETETYLTKLEALLGVEVKRISAKKFLNIGDKPGRNSFDIILNEYYGGFLPSPRSRWCTGTLKIKPFEMEIGDSFAYSFIGIRSDENREGYIPKKTHIITDSVDDTLKVDSPRKKPPVISHKQNIIPIAFIPLELLNWLLNPTLPKIELNHSHKRAWHGLWSLPIFRVNKRRVSGLPDNPNFV